MILSSIFSLEGTGLVVEYKRYSREIILSLRKIISPLTRHCLFSGHQGIWLIFVMSTGIAIRGYFLAQPMRYDEAFTFLSFVNRDFLYLFFYPLPNNHVLHTILVKISTLMFGAHPAIIRLPAFVAGIGLIPLVFCFCRKMQLSGFFASLAVSIFPYLVSYSTNARGYSLLVLLTVILAVLGAETIKQPSAVITILFSFIASLGMLTMPSMLFPIAGMFCWIVCLLLLRGGNVRSILFRFAVPCSVLTLILTILFYTPVIVVSNGIKSIVANRFVQSQQLDEFFNQLYSHFYETLKHFFGDIPRVIVFSCVMLVIIGIYASVKKQNWPLLLILPSLIFSSAILFFIQHRIPFPRTWIFFIPFILVLADSGFTYILEKVSPGMGSIVKVTTFIMGILVAASLISKDADRDAITNYPDAGYFQEAPIAAKYLKPIMTNNDTIYVRNPANWPMYFCLWYYGVPYKVARRNAENKSVLGREFFVVKKNNYTIDEMTDKSVVKLFNFENLAIYQSVRLEEK